MVNRNWLMECYQQKRRVPLRNYLVGDSIVSVDHQFDDEDEEILCSQPQDHAPAESSKGQDNYYYYCCGSNENQSFDANLFYYFRTARFVKSTC